MAEATLQAKDFKGEVHPDWCPGCGDFGVLNVLQRALAEKGLKQHEVAVISGIGCSSNLPGFINTYGMHTLHGRSLPNAQGFKLANTDMTVVACGGDQRSSSKGGDRSVPDCDLPSRRRVESRDGFLPTVDAR